jgi:LCP family protein required for cell wall assembly
LRHARLFPRRYTCFVRRLTTPRVQQKAERAAAAQRRRVLVFAAAGRALVAVTIVALLFAVVPPPRRAPGPIAPQVAHPAPPAPPPHGDERFLIVGLTQDQHRTDSIMVAQWDAVHHQARVLGVPRDIGVNIPNIGFTKLVHAYATGGVGRTRAAVVRLLNVPVAHYFVFSLPAMRHLVDLIGGVPITVEKRMVYHDREQGLFINLQPGPQVLDGAHAEQYLRFRNDPEGDIGRIRRQQHFLRAALAAVHRPQVWMRLPQIISAARADLGTDMTSEQLLGWAHEIDHLSQDAVTAQSIEGHPAVRFDAIMRMRLDFWVPDTDDLHAKVRWLVTGVLPTPKP